MKFSISVEIYLCSRWQSFIVLYKCEQRNNVLSRIVLPSMLFEDGQSHLLYFLRQL